MSIFAGLSRAQDPAKAEDVPGVGAKPHSPVPTAAGPFGEGSADQGTNSGSNALFSGLNVSSTTELGATTNGTGGGLSSAFGFLNSSATAPQPAPVSEEVSWPAVETTDRAATSGFGGFSFVQTAPVVPLPQEEVAVVVDEEAESRPKDVARPPVAEPRPPPPPPPPPPVPATSEGATPDKGPHDVKPEPFQPPPRMASGGGIAWPQAGSAQPVTPRTSLSRTFNVDGVRMWLEEQGDESTRSQRKVLEEQVACLTASQRLASDIADLRQRLTRTEADQNALCENERFEEAGALDATIQDVKEGIKRQLEEVANNARQMDVLAQRLLSVSQDRASYVEKALEKVKVLEQEGTDTLSDMESRNTRKMVAEDARLESERKRMDLARSHLERDSDNLKEEWQQVNDAIGQQTIDHEKERDEAAQKRTTVDAEIEELRLSLERKMEERRTLTEAVDGCEIRIAAIRSKFEKQLTRLEGKQRRLEEGQREVEQDAQQVERMATDLEREREACMDNTAQWKRQLDEIGGETRKLQRLRCFLSHNIRIRKWWQRLLEPHHETLNKARLRWEAATHEAALLVTASAEKEATAAKLRHQVDAVKLQLPVLEAEKKNAVATRNFKEAGRVSEDIKRRAAEQGALEAELEALQAGLATAREALVSGRQAEETAQAELSEAEASCAAEEVRILRRQVKDAQALCSKKSVTSADRDFLEQEIRVLQRSQEQLASKFGVDVNSLEDIVDEEAMPDDEVEEAPVTPSASRASSAEQPEAPPAPAPATPKQADAPADAPADALPADEPPQAARKVDPERRKELEELVAATEAREKAIQSELDEAINTEDFARAEELEEERLKLDKELTAARAELESLEPEEEEEVTATESPAEPEAAPPETQEPVHDEGEEDAAAGPGPEAGAKAAGAPPEAEMATDEM